MDPVQIIALIFAVLFFLQVILYTSKNKLLDKQAFLWIIFAIVSILIAVFLPLLNRFSHFIGISYAPSFVFMAAFLVVLYLLIYQTTVISNQQEKMKNVIQEIAFLKKQLDELNREREGSK